MQQYELYQFILYSKVRHYIKLNGIDSRSKRIFKYLQNCLFEHKVCFYKFYDRIYKDKLIYLLRRTTVEMITILIVVKKLFANSHMSCILVKALLGLEIHCKSMCYLKNHFKLHLNVEMNSKGYLQEIIVYHINNQSHYACFISPLKPRAGRVILVVIRNIRLLRFKHKNMKGKGFTFHFSMIQTVNRKF